MKVALAIIFFACIAGSMASDARGQFVDQLIQQGQAVAQTVFGLLQQQILALAQQAVAQLGQLAGSLGRFDFNFGQIVDQFKPIVAGLINQALGSVLGSLTTLIGSGRASIDFGAIFSGFYNEISGALAGIGSHFLNQGLGAVLGGLIGGRGIGDIFSGLSQQIAGLVGGAQSALQGALGNLSALGSNLLDATKPHLAQLQEQLVGHGLNVLGSLSETINNLHGSITGGR